VKHVEDLLVDLLYFFEKSWFFATLPMVSVLKMKQVKSNEGRGRIEMDRWKRWVNKAYNINASNHCNRHYPLYDNIHPFSIRSLSLLPFDFAFLLQWWPKTTLFQGLYGFVF
jgi:hypothetical protein